MRGAETFTMLPRKLDKVKLPGFAEGKLFIDFSEFPDGPVGIGLLKLLFELVGQPASEAAIRFGMAVDEECRAASWKIEAALKTGDPDRLFAIATNESVAWRSTPVLDCLAADGLIKLKMEDEALVILERTRGRFPGAVRPRQLTGLALARRGDVRAAHLLLAELEAEGNRDPETLGIYARTWMDRYRDTGDVLFLRKARNLYRLAFEHTPSNAYVGVNAASKSAMLGDREAAEMIAAQVEKLVGTNVTGGQNYWDSATVAEVQLLKGNWQLAANLFRTAVENHPSEAGSHASTFGQAKLLSERLGYPPECVRAIAAAFPTVPDARM
jgi:tetratricopeptide (TPR) repeat protein